MVGPTLTLFPASNYEQFEQVPLGRKKIDLFCVRRRKPLFCSVELKISNWQQALWQAIVNIQVSDESYIAIWHEFVHRAEKRAELLNMYGVGLIAVSQAFAQVVIKPKIGRRISRNAKRKWYQHLLRQDGNAPLSDLST